MGVSLREISIELDRTERSIRSRASTLRLLLRTFGAKRTSVRKYRLATVRSSLTCFKVRWLRSLVLRPNRYRSSRPHGAVQRRGGLRRWT